MEIMTTAKNIHRRMYPQTDLTGLCYKNAQHIIISGTRNAFPFTHVGGIITFVKHFTHNGFDIHHHIRKTGFLYLI